MIGRRGFITGLVSLVAAPAIVRAGSLMPVKAMLIEPEEIYAVISAGQYSDLVTAAMYDLMAFGSVAVRVPNDPYEKGQIVRLHR